MKIILCLAFCLLLGNALSVPSAGRGSIPAFLQMNGPCRTAGHTNGCCNGGEVACFVESGQCSCDERCYTEGSCCEDIQDIGCLPITCATARLPAGCCDWSSANCYVSARQCYCDSFCFMFNDCCSDVTQTCSNKDIQLSYIQGLSHRRRSSGKLNRYERQRQADIAKMSAARKLLKLLSSD